MRKVLMMVAVVAAAAMMGSAWAQDTKPSTDGNGKAANCHRGHGELFKGVNLTDDQKPKVKDIMTKQKTAIEAWRKENGPKLKDLHEKMVQARKDKDEASIKSTKADIQKIWESRKALHESLMKSLGGVLTADQMTKVKENFKECRAERGQGQRHKGGPTTAPAK